MDLLLSIPAAVWLVLSAIFFAAGEYFSKRWAMHPSLGITASLLVVYILATLFWLPALLHKNQLAIMGMAWLLLGMIATVCLGLFVFNEKLSTLQMVGIIFALLSLVLLNTH